MEVNGPVIRYTVITGPRRPTPPLTKGCRGSRQRRVLITGTRPHATKSTPTGPLPPHTDYTVHELTGYMQATCHLFQIVWGGINSYRAANSLSTHCHAFAQAGQRGCRFCVVPVSQQLHDITIESRSSRKPLQNATIRGSGPTLPIFQCCEVIGSLQDESVKRILQSIRALLLHPVVVRWATPAGDEPGIGQVISFGTRYR